MGEECVAALYKIFDDIFSINHPLSYNQEIRSLYKILQKKKDAKEKDIETSAMGLQILPHDVALINQYNRMSLDFNCDKGCHDDTVSLTSPQDEVPPLPQDAVPSGSQQSPPDAGAPDTPKRQKMQE